MAQDQPGIIQAVQDENEKTENLDALQAFGDELWAKKYEPRAPLKVPTVDELVKELESDKKSLDKNFKLLDTNNDGKIGIEELVNLKLTRAADDGTVGPVFFPEELKTIERLFFNARLRNQPEEQKEEGKPEEPGLSMSDVDGALAHFRKLQSVPPPPLPPAEDLPASDADAKPPEPKADAKPPEPKADAKPPEPKADAKPPEPKADAKLPEPKADAKPPEPKADAKPPEPKADAKPPEPKADAKPPEPKADAKPPEPKADAKPPEPKADGLIPLPPAPAAPPPLEAPPAVQAPAASQNEVTFDYGYTKLSFGKNSTTGNLEFVKEGNSVWEKRADDKWYNKDTNTEIAGKLSMLPDGTFRHDIKDGVYRTVSPIGSDGYARRTIHRSDGTEVSALYQADQKQPSKIIEYHTSNPSQQTIWQPDANDARIWKNGNQVRYDLALQSNGNVTYSIARQQAGQYAYEGRVISNNGAELRQGLDLPGHVLGEDGLPRYTFDGWGDIVAKEYAAGNRQNAFHFAYQHKPDGSSEVINVTYQERHWDAQNSKHEAYKTMSYSQVKDNQWQLTTNNVPSGSLAFKPILSADGRVAAQYVENGVWVQTDYDLMTKTYLTANRIQQYQNVNSGRCQPTYNRRNGIFGGLFRRF